MCIRDRGGSGMSSWPSGRLRNGAPPRRSRIETVVYHRIAPHPGSAPPTAVRGAGGGTVLRAPPPQREIRDRPYDVDERQGAPHPLGAFDLVGRPPPDVGERRDQERDLDDAEDDDQPPAQRAALTPLLLLGHVTLRICAGLRDGPD